MAGIYCRISDDREGREHGVERQRADCLELAHREGLTLVEVYTDNDLSASARARKSRPQFDRLLADARAGRIGVIIAYSSSRLTRRMREHEDLIDLALQHKVRYLFVKSPSFDLNSADGAMVARMLAVADQAEADRASERVHRDVRRRAQASEFHGGPRGYGVTADGTTLAEAEADRIREWAAHVMAGGRLGTLARRLNAAGELTPAGNEWKPWVIRRILLAPRIAGLRVVDGAEYEASNPAIVAADVWRALTRKLTDPSRRIHMQGPARRHLGTGLYLCDRCNVTVRVTYHVSGRRLYLCTCYRTWDATKLDAFVVETTEAGLADEDRLARLLPRAAAGVNLAGLRAEAKAIGENLDALAVSFATAGGRTLAALQAGIAEGEKRLAEIEQTLAVAGRSDGLIAVATADDPIAVFRSLDDLARRQSVVRGLMEIRLGPPIRGRAKWAPEKFLGASRWVGDGRTWADHWA